MARYQMLYTSPIGSILLGGNEKGLTDLIFTEEKIQDSKNIPDYFNTLTDELDAYFQGKRKTFTVPLELEGTPFRKKVWKELMNIPYGQVDSYKGIAIKVDNPKAVRAVGGANHNNPISIIVPCHRVVGSNGSLTGYGGGLWRKEWLLGHEKKYAD